jgi:two-component system alkaline phosphatase synthesis response regulator PhoP
LAAQRILVVDDDRDILDLLKYNLRKEGFEVRCVSNSHKAVRAALRFKPDLVVLDIMMPHPNGIEICRELRLMERFRNTFIFFLTAKTEPYFHEAAYDAGGDDLVEKITSIRALTSKINIVLRDHFVIRKRQSELTLGKLQINRRKSIVRVADREVKLSLPEMELLYFFAQNPDRAITRDQLLTNLWSTSMLSWTSSLDALVEKLAEKLGKPWIVSNSEGLYSARLI